MSVLVLIDVNVDVDVAVRRWTRCDLDGEPSSFYITFTSIVLDEDAPRRSAE